MSRATLRRVIAYPVVLLMVATAVARAVDLVTRALARALGKCHLICIIVHDAAPGWMNVPCAVDSL